MKKIMSLFSLNTELVRARHKLQTLKRRPKLHDYGESVYDYSYTSNRPKSVRWWRQKRKEEEKWQELLIRDIELSILEAEDEHRERQDEKYEEIKDRNSTNKNSFIKSEINTSNDEGSITPYLILVLLLLPLMTLPMPLAFLFYGLLSWLWLGTYAMLKIFLVCTTVYLYSSGYIFFSSLMLFMIGVISFIKLKKDIGSPSLSSMKGPERFKYRKRRNLVAIIWLVFCLLVAYQPDFVFVMMLIAIPFLIGYFFYLVGNNLI